MFFAVWFGTMRPKPKDRGRGWEMIPGNWYFRPKTPRGRFYVKNLAKPGEHTDQQTRGIYNADDNGCIEVNHPEHINVFVGLGYPIWDGVTKFVVPTGMYTDVRRQGLIWPDQDAYDTRVLEGISKIRRI